jgi:two-component system, LuxR family, response regulator FixJ
MKKPIRPTKLSDYGTVYIVDDDEAACRSVLALVSATGLEAQAFPSAEEFLESRLYTEPGCVVTDVRLHGISGLDLLQEIRTRGANIPVILVTAYADVKLAVDAMSRGSQTLLEKPYRDHDLWDQIVLALRADYEQRTTDSRVDEMQSRLETLTESERNVLSHLIQGHPNKLIASSLDIAPRTVDLRRQMILRKMRASTILNLVSDLGRAGLLDAVLESEMPSASPAY